MVPNTRDDLPEPETPVNTVNRRFGIATLTSFRLFSRAPWTRIRSWSSAACCWEGGIWRLEVKAAVTLGWGSGRGAERVAPVGHESHQQPHHRAPDQRIGRSELERVARIQRGQGKRLQREDRGGDWRERWHPLGGGRDDQQNAADQLQRSQHAPADVRQDLHLRRQLLDFV